MLQDAITPLEVVITSLVMVQDATTPLDLHNNFIGNDAGCTTPLEIIITSLVNVQDNATPLELIITSWCHGRIL